jgi:hypothetical protein
MKYITAGGLNVIKAHLEHLRDHGEFEYLTQALEYLHDNKFENPLSKEEHEEKKLHHGCPGSKESIIETIDAGEEENGFRISHLRQWPIQLHLVSPNAPYYRNSNLLVAADCCGFAYPDFHKDFLKGKSLAIACPKLDSNKHIYIEKLVAMINESNLKSIMILIMQVPCCSGLLQLVQHAVEISKKSVPVSITVINHTGEILRTAQLSL